MSVAVTVLSQKHVAGIGLITTGTFNLSSTYATGGDASNLVAKLAGRGTVDAVHCGFDDDYTAHYQISTHKLRIFKLATGVPTERSNGSSYDSNVAIPFTAYSR